MSRRICILWPYERRTKTAIQYAQSISAVLRDDTTCSVLSFLIVHIIQHFTQQQNDDQEQKITSSNAWTLSVKTDV